MGIVRSQLAPAHGEHHPVDDMREEDETWRELPPRAVGSAERRMQVRAYNCWAGLLGERQFPAIEGLTPEKLARFGPYAVLLDFTQDRRDPAIGYIGAALAEECGLSGAIRRLSEVPAGSLLSRITGEYTQVLGNQAPTGFEAEFVNWRGATILYRGILLPFSGDDTAIDHVLGVINWKELVDAQVADELQMQMSRTVAPRDALGRSRHDAATASEWADGPEGRSGRAFERSAELALEAAFPDERVTGSTGLDEGLAERLRQLEPRPMTGLAAQGDEFALLLARRMPGGEVAVLGEVGADASLLDAAARDLLG